MKIIQYNSVFYHGHSNYCPIPNNEKEIEMAAKTSQVKTKIETLANHFIKHFDLSNVYIDYVGLLGRAISCGSTYVRLGDDPPMCRRC